METFKQLHYFSQGKFHQTDFLIKNVFIFSRKKESCEKKGGYSVFLPYKILTALFPLKKRSNYQFEIPFNFVTGNKETILPLFDLFLTCLNTHTSNLIYHGKRRELVTDFVENLSWCKLKVCKRKAVIMGHNNVYMLRPDD